MDGLLLPLLIAATVAMTSIGVWQLASVFLDKERRKLTERLSTDGRFDPIAPSARAIKIQIDSGDIPSLLSRSAFFNELHRNLALPLPGMSLVKFLSISGGRGALRGLIMLVVGVSTLPAGGGGGGGEYPPFFLLNFKRNRRSKALNDQLPEALD